jgi:hypothetical protein
LIDTLVWFRYSTFIPYFHSAIKNEAAMQVLSTRESRMQILTYKWVSNFVEKILKIIILNFIHNIFKKKIDKKGDIKFSAHEAHLE